MKKKIFCLFLCLTMCFSLLPTWAFAEEEQAEEDIVVEEEILTEEPAAEEPVEEDVVEELEFVVEEMTDEAMLEKLQDTSSFDALEAACKDGTTYWEVWPQTLTIERNLTIPAGMRVMMTEDNAKVIVPDGVTLTVNGIFFACGIEIQGDGKVEISGEDSWLVLEPGTWSEDLKQKITCSDGGFVQINAYPESLDQLYDALDSYQPEDSICRSFEVSFSCALTRENTVIPRNAAVSISRKDENISLTIPEGKTLTIEKGGELYIVGSELIFNGDMVNNGAIWMYPTWEDGQQKDQPKVTMGDNAEFSGTGTAVFGNQPYTFVNNRTLFEQLKSACENGTEIPDLRNRGNFVIRESLIIPQGFQLETWGTWIIIPSGITVTVADGASFAMHNLQVDEGGAVVVGKNGFFNCFTAIRLNGKIKLGENVDSHFPSDGMDDAARARVSFEGENSRANIHYPANDKTELYNAVTQAKDLVRPFSGNIQLRFNWSLEEDFVVEEGWGIDIDGAYNNASLTIPAERKLTVNGNGYLNSESGVIKVQGALENNGRLELRRNDDPNADHPGMGRIDLDGGSYSGTGSIYVQKTENPDECLQGFKLTDFERTEQDDWFVYVNAGAVFADFQKACNEASEENPIQYDGLTNLGTFTIPESIVIPAGLAVNGWNTVIMIPKGVVLTVRGRFYPNDMVIENGGQIILEPGGDMWINESLRLDGNITVNDNWFGIPADDWEESMMGSRITVNGEDAGINLNIRADRIEDIQSAPDKYPVTEHVHSNISVFFDWTPENFYFPQGVDINIQGSQGGSLTIPKGTTFENAGGYLGLQKANLTVKGTMKNNGFIDVRNNDGVRSHIMVDGGAYMGNGTVCVRDAADEKEAASYLGGLTELGSFQVEKQNDGIYFQLREPDWTFAHLQEVCAETYKEGDDNFREIPNEAPLTIEENLTIPENLILVASGAIVVPEGKTLTIRGSLHCAGLVADGSVILTDGGYLNVYGSQLEGKGTISVRTDSHMDVNTEAWKGGEWGVKHLTFTGDRSYGTVWYDVWNKEDALAAVADAPLLGDRMGRSLNIHFDWTLKEDLTLPDEMHMEIRGKDGAALTIPTGITLTSSNALRAQGADVKVLGTLVNNSRLEVYWDDEHQRLGKVSVESGGKYAGDGDIWVETLVNPADCLRGIDLRAYESGEEEGGTIYRKTGGDEAHATSVGTALNVLGEIGVVYYINIPDELMDGIYAELTMGNKVVIVPKSDFRKSGSNYTFGVSLPAAEDRTKVALKLVNDDGIVPLTGDRCENNQYIDSIYNYLKRQENGSSRFASFAKAMRNYCEYARQNFGNDPGIPLDLDPMELDRSLLAPFALAEGSLPAGISFAGLQLNLEAATSLRIVFTLASGRSIRDYTFRIDDRDATASLLSGSMYYVEVPNIPAAELDSAHTVSINGTQVVRNVSALTYAYRGLGNASYTQNLKETLMALYYYNQAANAYFGK